jgi:hypothetical protein
MKQGFCFVGANLGPGEEKKFPPRIYIFLGEKRGDFFLQDVYCPIKWDLLRVRERMNRHYTIKAGSLRDFSHLEKYADRDICPALVLYAARMYGTVTARVISLAQVFQFIYLAVMLHRDINEDEQIAVRAEPGDGCQYPVLVGDYLYGRFFTTLCEADIVEYLGPLSEIICMINEGGVIRLKQSGGEKASSGTRLEIIRLEMAELLAGCCKMGGKMAGAGRESQEQLYRFGFALGMALGLAGIDIYDRSEAYFKEALSLLEGLNPGEDRDDLRNLVVYLSGVSKENRRMVC